LKKYFAVLTKFYIFAAKKYMGLFDKLFGGIKKSLDSLADEQFKPEPEPIFEPVYEQVKQPIKLIDDKFKQDKKLSDDKQSWIDETDVMLNMVLTEFKQYPFKDKCQKYINLNSLPQLEYTFESQRTVNFIFTNDKKFGITFFKEGKFKYYIITSKRLYKILNEISNFADTCGERPAKSEPIVDSKYAHIDPSIKEKYNLIVRQIKLRQEELNKIPKNDKKRIPLENELAAYKKAADRIKLQFK
jgi:hypothetical protein